MQRIVGMLLVLLGLVWLASELPATPDDPQPRMTSWRRTCDGWEHADRLCGDKLSQPPTLHPALVGLALLVSTVTLLVGLSPNERPAAGANTRGPVGNSTGG